MLGADLHAQQQFSVWSKRIGPDPLARESLFDVACRMSFR